jgi:hypothetical protein
LQGPQPGFDVLNTLITVFMISACGHLASADAARSEELVKDPER